MVYGAVAALMTVGCVEEHPGWQAAGATGGATTGATSPGSTGGTATSTAASSASSDTGTSDIGTGGLPSEHVIFVTSTFVDGALGGLAGADAECQARAAAGGLPGTFAALLSDDNQAASTRITISGPVRDRMGQLVAADAAELWSGTLQLPVGYNESGADASGAVWSGSTAAGLPKTTCLNWSSNLNAEFGTQGNHGDVDATWLELSDDRCFKVKSLFCINQ
jgi:hypothetical protein